MKFNKRLGNTSNIVVLTAVLIIIIIIGILAREQIKNKWISTSLFGNKKIMPRENFIGTLDKYRVNTGVYSLKYDEGIGIKVKVINHNNSYQAFGDMNDTISYNIDNTIYYSKPRDLYYSLKTGIEFNWSYARLGTHGHFKVESGAGTFSPWFVKFTKNGQNINIGGSIGSRGLNMVYIPPYGKGKSIGKAFDALAAYGFENQITKFIDNDMPDHSIFMIAVLDEAGQQNYRDYYIELGDKISAPEFKWLSWRASYAYIGIKLRNNNYELIGENRAPDGTQKASATSVDAYLNPYYIFPTRAGKNPLRQGPIRHRSLHYVSVPQNNYGYHNVPDGEYTIEGKAYNIYVAQIPNTIQQYNIYKISGPDGNRSVKRKPNSPYTMMGKRLGTDGNHHYNVKMFKADGNAYILDTIIRNNKKDNNISFNYLPRSGKSRVRHNFIIQNNSNKYLSFAPAANSELKTIAHQQPDTVLKSRPEHLIAKILNYNGDSRHAIVFFTAKKILYVKSNGHIGFEDINDDDIIKHLKNNDNIGHHSRFNNDKYKFSIMPTPMETVTGGSSQQTTDGSVIIFHRTIASPTTDINYTGKITYKYLSVNEDTVELINSSSFKNSSNELKNEFKFKLSEITDSNDNNNIDCVLINYFKTSTENDVDYVHINNTTDNPDRESNCRFVNLFKQHENNCTPNNEGCKAYKPTYIDTIDNHLRIPDTDYKHIPNRKIGHLNQPRNSYTNKSIKQCKQLCDSDDGCYVFTFKDNLGNNPVTLSECKTYEPGDSANKVNDNAFDLYQLEKTAEIRKQDNKPIPTRIWSAAEKIYANSPCSASTNENSCSVMNDTCRFARGRCNPLCENTATGCVSNKVETIGSVSDFNISLAFELLGTTQIKVTITNVKLVDIRKNFSFPIIKSDGITVEFIKGGNAEYSSNRSDNNNITVNYVIDYLTNASQYKYINTNDTFIIDIPPVLCNSNCDRLREHIIKITFTDVYNRTKSFQQFLPDKVVSQISTPTTTRPYDNQALTHIRENQNQIASYIS